MPDINHLTSLTADGLRLEILHYSGGPETPTFCIPGLTRNAADFDDLAAALAQKGRDVYAVSLRGRGRSDYDPDFRNYHPQTYRDDILALLDGLNITRAVFVGTSLGGIVTMLVNEIAPDRVAGAVLNDIGPALAPEGLARIASYAGRDTAHLATFEQAVSAIRATNAVAFPDRDEAFWRKFAERTYRQDEKGWRLDYDPAIGKALTEAAPIPDLWPPFAALKTTPTLIIRGAISDLLTPPIITEMRKTLPDFDYCEVPGAGHAPTLTEPISFSALTAFLKKTDA